MPLRGMRLPCVLGCGQPHPTLAEAVQAAWRGLSPLSAASRDGAGRERPSARKRPHDRDLVPDAELAERQGAAFGMGALCDHVHGSFPPSTRSEPPGYTIVSAASV